MDLLRIYDDEDLRSLPSGVWGIKEPMFQHGDAPRTKGPSVPSRYPYHHHLPKIKYLTIAFTDRRRPDNSDGRGQRST
jgi:hypothetical protein